MVTVLNPQVAAERPPQLLLTLEEAGERLSVSGRQVRILVDEGKLPSVHIGRLHRIRQSDLERYVESLAKHN